MTFGDFPSNVVKTLSCAVISGALGLELWNVLAHTSPYLDWQLVFWFGRFVLISHGIEAVAAAFYAPAKQKPALGYGIYTFFVGTIGLVELVQLPQGNLNQP